MSRETELRATLDSLFYADALNQRLDELGDEICETFLSKATRESAKAYRQRLIALVSDWFGGYSISLVNGRFRAAALQTRADAVDVQLRTSRPYLIDETTASVRFIVPIAASEFDEDHVGTLDLSTSSGAIAAETDRIRNVFFQIFVEHVTRIVNGEDTIWLIEESPRGRLLHAWEKVSQ